jgi:hypothetical protein
MDHTHSRVPNSPHLSCPLCERWFSSVNALTKHGRTIHRPAPKNSGHTEPSTSFNDERPPSPPSQSIRLGPHQNMSPISSPHFRPQPSGPTLSHPERPPNVEGDLSYQSSPRHPHSSRLSDNNGIDGLDGVSTPDLSFSQIYPPLDQPYDMYDSPGSPNDPYEPTASPLYPFDPPVDPPGSLPPLNPPRECLAQPAHSNHDHTSDATDDPSITKTYHPIINGV